MKGTHLEQDYKKDLVARPLPSYFYKNSPYGLIFATQLLMKPRAEMLNLVSVMAYYVEGRSELEGRRFAKISFDLICQFIDSVKMMDRHCQIGVERCFVFSSMFAEQHECRPSVFQQIAIRKLLPKISTKRQPCRYGKPCSLLLPTVLLFEISSKFSKFS